jgi:hypothetical protein
VQHDRRVNGPPSCDRGLGAGGSQIGGAYGVLPLSNTTLYFRITVRVAGPRNTTSYVQSIMY